MFHAPTEVLIFFNMNKHKTGSDAAKIDYVSLAYSVGMVVAGILVGFTAAYLNKPIYKKILGVFGFIATCYMIWTALFQNATGLVYIHFFWL